MPPNKRGAGLIADWAGAYHNVVPTIKWNTAARRAPNHRDLKHHNTLQDRKLEGQKRRPRSDLIVRKFDRTETLIQQMV